MVWSYWGVVGPINWLVFVTSLSSTSDCIKQAVTAFYTLVGWYLPVSLVQPYWGVVGPYNWLVFETSVSSTSDCIKQAVTAFYTWVCWYLPVSLVQPYWGVVGPYNWLEFVTSLSHTSELVNSLFLVLQQLNLHIPFSLAVTDVLILLDLTVRGFMV